MSNETLSSVDARSELSKLGFYRIDDLKWYEAVQDENGLVRAEPYQLGKYHHDGDLIVAYLENREVWRARRPFTDEVRKLLKKVCPRGNGAAAPFQSGAMLDQEDMEYRFADHRSNCGGRAGSV